MIPYSLILLVAVVWLAARHFHSPAVPAHSKRLVTLLTFSSIAAVWMLPQASLPAAIIQIGICAYVILYSRVTTLTPDQARPRREPLAEPLAPSAAPDVQRKL
jgi:hypothetical protein